MLASFPASGGFIAEMLPGDKNPIAGAGVRAEGILLIGTAFGAIFLPGGPFTAYPGDGGAAHCQRGFGATIAMVVSWTLIGYGHRGGLGIADPQHDFHAVADRDLAADPGAGRRARPLRLRADVSEGPALVNISALIIDVTLWGSVLILGFMAWQRGRVVLVWSWVHAEGSMDFINIVPRIALGVIGSGYIAAVIPPKAMRRRLARA